MTTDMQRPIGTGFHSRSTASDVLGGLDLRGRTAIVTGGHSGLGLETTRALAQAGAQVIVASRDVENARAALQPTGGAVALALDLADPRSVAAFAQDILSSGRRIDMLINNAGIMACPEARTAAGWDAQFATNHLGHFALTNRIWPALARNARVVTVSSAGHHLSPMRWDDVHFTRAYDKWLAYGQSKTANALFALHLDKLGREDGVRAFSLHPGKIFTPLQRHLRQEEMIAAGWLDSNGKAADPTFKTPAQGAATQVWAATSPMLEGLGGLYCEDCDVARRAEETGLPLVGVCAHASDAAEAERLWALSAELTGLDAFAAR